MERRKRECAYTRWRGGKHWPDAELLPPSFNKKDGERDEEKGRGGRERVLGSESLRIALLYLYCGASRARARLSRQRDGEGRRKSAAVSLFKHY